MRMAKSACKRSPLRPRTKRRTLQFCETKRHADKHWSITRDMSTGDHFITLFGTSETDTYTVDERLAFLKGYHDALEIQDPNTPLSILPGRYEAPPGLEQ